MTPVVTASRSVDGETSVLSPHALVYAVYAPPSSFAPGESTAIRVRGNGRLKIAGMEYFSSTPKDDQGKDALVYSEAKVERSLMYFASTNPSQKFGARTFPPWHSIPRSISVLVNKQPLII